MSENSPLDKIRNGFDSLSGVVDTFHETNTYFYKNSLTYYVTDKYGFL
ncbi:hypothetical protein VCRA2120E57_10043 [Vibrio crassostreae]|nr:hypothetical protein VCRA2120E57_10043 [Vibrio crassostreae]